MKKTVWKKKKMNSIYKKLIEILLNKCSDELQLLQPLMVYLTDPLPKAFLDLARNPYQCILHA